MNFQIAFDQPCTKIITKSDIIILPFSDNQWQNIFGKMTFHQNICKQRWKNSYTLRIGQLLPDIRYPRPPQSMLWLFYERIIQNFHIRSSFWGAIYLKCNASCLYQLSFSQPWLWGMGWGLIWKFMIVFNTLMFNLRGFPCADIFNTPIKLQQSLVKRLDPRWASQPGLILYFIIKVVILIDRNR